MSVRRPPAPLTLLLAATLLIGVCWALVVPPFQAPDEPAHVAYVQSIAERGALPGAVDRPSGSTEQQLAGQAANSDQTAAVRATKPTWGEAAYERWRRRSAALPESARGDGGGPNFASANPPLYYLWSVIPYEVASGGDLFARVTAMRIASVAFLLVTVAATWLLAGTVFGPRRDLQLAAAAVPALLPMLGFISASVSPDSLLYALWTVALWLGARILRGRGRPAELIALVVVTGMAVATKATSYALVAAGGVRARRFAVAAARPPPARGGPGRGRGGRGRAHGGSVVRGGRQLRPPGRGTADRHARHPRRRQPLGDRQLHVAVLSAAPAVPTGLRRQRVAAPGLGPVGQVQLGSLRLARGAVARAGLLGAGPRGGCDRAARSCAC